MDKAQNRINNEQQKYLDLDEDELKAIKLVVILIDQVRCDKLNPDLNWNNSKQLSSLNTVTTNL